MNFLEMEMGHVREPILLERFCIIIWFMLCMALFTRVVPEEERVMCEVIFMLISYFMMIFIVIYQIF